MALPLEDSGPVEDRLLRSVADTSAAQVLTALRKFYDNAELNAAIGTELRKMGSAAVFFTPTDLGGENRAHADAELPTRSTTFFTAPVLVGRNPIGHLHCRIDTNAQDVDRGLVQLMAAGLGAIFERNVLAERLQRLTVSAVEHAHAIQQLADGYE